MNGYQIFIDGAAGTTGLQVQNRLETQPDLALIVLDDADRKDDAIRADAMAAADVTILCLPDEAAKTQGDNHPGDQRARQRRVVVK